MVREWGGDAGGGGWEGRGGEGGRERCVETAELKLSGCCLRNAATMKPFLASAIFSAIILALVYLFMRVMRLEKDVQTLRNRAPPMDLAQAVWGMASDGPPEPEEPEVQRVVAVPDAFEEPRVVEAPDAFEAPRVVEAPDAFEASPASNEASPASNEALVLEEEEHEDPEIVECLPPLKVVEPPTEPTPPPVKRQGAPRRKRPPAESADA